MKNKKIKNASFILFSTFMMLLTTFANAKETFHLCLADAEKAAVIKKIENGNLVSTENRTNTVADNLLVPFATKVYEKEAWNNKSHFVVLKDANGNIQRCSEVAGKSNLVSYQYEYAVHVENKRRKDIVEVAFTMAFILGVIVQFYLKDEDRQRANLVRWFQQLKRLQ